MVVKKRTALPRSPLPFLKKKLAPGTFVSERFWPRLER